MNVGPKSLVSLININELHNLELPECNSFATPRPVERRNAKLCSHSTMATSIFDQTQQYTLDNYVAVDKGVAKLPIDKDIINTLFVSRF